MNMAGLNMEQFQDATGAITAVLLAVVITLISVIGIYYISKWGEIETK